MNAAVAFAREVEDMSVEERLIRIESDMGHALSTLVELKGDAKSTKGEIKEVSGEVQQVRTELQSFKTEVAKEFGSVRVEIAGTKTEIEKVRTSLERAKVWLIVLVFGVTGSIVGQGIALYLTLRK